MYGKNLTSDQKRRRVVLKRVNLDRTGVRANFLQTGTIAQGAAETGVVEAYMCRKIALHPRVCASLFFVSPLFLKGGIPTFRGGGVGFFTRVAGPFAISSSVLHACWLFVLCVAMWYIYVHFTRVVQLSAQVRQHVASYKGSFTAEASVGGFTKGTQWLVWDFESDSTLADACDGTHRRLSLPLIAPAMSGSTHE